MVSFSMEPQWCGALYSVCAHREKPGSALGLPHIPDVFAVCSISGPPLHVDWIAFGYDICSASSTWALIFEAVKASGVILLLGVGSLVCYKLYNYYWPRSRSSLSTPDSSPGPLRHSDFCVAYNCEEDELIEDVDTVDHSLIQGCYFGPVNGLEKGGNQLNTSEGGSSQEHNEKMVCKCVRHCPLHHEAAAPEVHHYAKLSWRCPKHICSRQHAKPTNWLLKKLGDIINLSSSNKIDSGANITRDILRPTEMERYKARQLQLLKSNEEPLLTSFYEEKDFYCQACQKTPASNVNPALEIRSAEESHLVRDESYDSLGFSKGLPSEGSLDSVCSELSTDLSLPEFSVGASTMVRFDGIQQVINQIKNNCDNMSEDFEIIKCNRNLPGMSSLMKANTGLTEVHQELAESLPKEEMENLKEEKARACFAGLYSLTVINNSTSSELSDVCLNPENKQGSFGSAESFEWDSPNHLVETEAYNTEDNSDHRYINSEVLLVKSNDTADVKIEQFDEIAVSKLDKDHTNEIINKRILTTSNEDELVADLEWDDDLIEYTEENGNINDGSSFLQEAGAIEMDMETEIGSVGVFNKSDLLKDGVDSAVTSFISTKSSSDTYSNERFSGMESSGFGSLMLDSITSLVSPQSPDSNKQLPVPWNTEESDYMDWDMAIDPPIPEDLQGNDEKSITFSSSYTSGLSSSINSYSDLTSPANENMSHSLPVIQNIGEKVDILKYAIQEWKGNTRKCETILKGYAEIPVALNTHKLRCVRGDNYCGIRAAIFQIMVQGLPVPSGSSTFEILSEVVNNPSGDWILDWTFAGRLPYKRNHVLTGMESCLQRLDNMSCHLATFIVNREDEVASMLNTNQSLDLHIMEAVKLHMLAKAIQLYHKYTNGEDVPFFAVLMFSRDTSETLQDFVRNHLCDVGNTGGLEQIEMFLLGYTLNVSLRVVRPSSYGTDEYICSYPDCFPETWPQVLLIAEDDRHYNVLIR